MERESPTLRIDESDLRPIRELAYESLRRAIMEGRLPPGDRLIEATLAEEMGISRMPVREALRKLETEGLVARVPRGGVVVRGFDPEDILEVYTIRMALEVVATLKASERITPEEIEALQGHLDRAARASARADAGEPGADREVFEAHRAFSDGILRASRMRRLIGLIQTFNEYLERFRRVTLSRPERRQRVQREHQAILEAVRRSDRTAIERLVRAHLEGAQASYLGAFGLTEGTAGPETGPIGEGGGNAS